MISNTLEIANRRMQFCLSDGSGRQIYANFSLTGAATQVLSYRNVTLYSDSSIIGNRELIDFFQDGTNSQFGKQGVNVGPSATSATGGTDVISVGNWISGTTYATKMKFQELILFDNADRTSERAAMRTSINDRYAIY